MRFEPINIGLPRTLKKMCSSPRAAVVVFARSKKYFAPCLAGTVATPVSRVMNVLFAVACNRVWTAVRLDPQQTSAASDYPMRGCARSLYSCGLHDIAILSRRHAVTSFEAFPLQSTTS